MSTASTVARVAKAVVKAPLRASRKALRKMRDNPVTTGLVFLAADIATKFPIRKLYEAGIKIDTCADNSFHVCFETVFNPGSSNFYFVGLGTASLVYLFAKTNSQTIKLAAALMLSCCAGNIGETGLFGNMTDFIKIGPWPNFNIADAANVFGFLTILYDCGSSGKTSQEKPGWWNRIKNALFSLKTWKARVKTVISSLFTRNILNTIGQTYLYVVSLFMLIDFLHPRLWFIYPLLSLIRDIRHRSDRRMFE